MATTKTQKKVPEKKKVSKPSSKSTPKSTRPVEGVHYTDVRVIPSTKTKLLLQETSSELQKVQRMRAIVIKSRNMQNNRLQAIVAGTLGYWTGMEEKDRQKTFKVASEKIKEIRSGGGEGYCFRDIVQATLVGVDQFDMLLDGYEKQMKDMAKKLPIHAWVEKPEQRGFGTLFLAIIIGEAGDLSNFSNPGKLWRRFGCNPWEFEQQCLMGSTWRTGKYGKLPAEEWKKFGYSPRRRSIAYLIGEGLCKQNGAAEAKPDVVTKEGMRIPAKAARPSGPYRLLYDEAKAKFKEKYPDSPDIRCHRHGMLIASKRLLKNLWIEWRKQK